MSSVFTNSIYAKSLADVIGFGVTLNPVDNSVLTVTGPVVRTVTGAPSTADAASSLALRRDTGALYINVNGTSGGWVVVGGSGGWNLPNDVSGVWGTTGPLQVASVYVSASNRFDLGSQAVSQATAQATASLRFETGTDTITGAVAGAASGSVEIRSGSTDCTNAGGTGGASGGLTFSTGNAASTLGVSGFTGNVSLVTGNSDDGNSGSIVLTIGTAAGSRGVIDINAPTIDTQTQNIQFLGQDNNAASFQFGSSGALNTLVVSTVNGAEQVIVNGVAGLSLPNNIGLKFGTSVNDIFTEQYNSGSSRFELSGTAITAGGATQATRPLAILTGNRILNDAAGSPATGSLTISSGASNVNFAGGGATGGASGAVSLSSGTTDITAGANTGGASGAVTVESGAATSTGAGTSGASGAVTVRSGASDDAATGALILATGNAGTSSGGASLSSGSAAGANNSGLVAISSGTTATGTTGNVTIASGNATGAGTSGNITLTPGATVGGTRGRVVATGLQQVSATNNAIAGAVALIQADSGGTFTVSQAAAYDIDLPNPTAGAGLHFTFVLGTAGANNVTITVAGGAATFIGTIVNDVTSVIPSTGSTLTFASGTAALGDNIEIRSVGTNLYFVRAVTSAAGGITIA